MLSSRSKADSFSDRPVSANAHLPNVRQVKRFVHINFASNVMCRCSLCLAICRFGIYSGEAVVCFQLSGINECRVPALRVRTPAHKKTAAVRAAAAQENGGLASAGQRLRREPTTSGLGPSS